MTTTVHRFDGAVLDGSAWLPFVGNRWDPSLVAVSGGALHLVTDGIRDAGVKSRWTVRYGRVEVTARLDRDPAASAGNTGGVLALWPTTDRWPTDVEVVFAEQRDGLRTIHAPKVRWGTSSTPALRPTVAVPDGFDGTSEHTYGVTWSPSGLRFEIDDECVASVTEPAGAVPSSAHALTMHFGLNTRPGIGSASIGMHITQVVVRTDEPV